MYDVCAVPKTASSTKIKKFNSLKFRLAVKKWGLIVGLPALLVLGVLAFFVAQFALNQEQDTRSSAAFCSGAFDCSVRCNDGHVSSDICPAYGAYGSCDQWGSDACGPHGGVREKLKDGGTGKNYDDGTGSSSGGNSAYICPNNSVTAQGCRNKAEGTSVAFASGSCTCRKTAFGCSCRGETPGESGSGSSPTQTQPPQTNVYRCDNKEMSHTYCENTFGPNFYCAGASSESIRNCIRKQSPGNSCQFNANNPKYPVGGDVTRICGQGSLCNESLGTCALPCKDSSQCGQGYFCDTVRNVGKCLPRPRLGEECWLGEGEQCRGIQRCENYICVL